MESEITTTKEKKCFVKDPYTKRQLYKVWWNFLSLSPKYENFCEIMRNNIKRQWKQYKGGDQ